MKSEIEIELGVDDPLSKSTARLSLCQADMEEETEGNTNPRLQVRELLQREKDSIQRRDSAVSLNSFLEEEEENDQQQQQQQHLSPKKKSRSKKIAEKRRRSSAQSLSIVQQQPPLKREKIHKRKLKKRLQPPNIELVLDKFEEEQDKDSELKRFPFRNLRSLILKVFNVPGTNTLKWCNIENGEKIPTVCVCLVPGLQLEENSTETTDTGLQPKDEKSKQQCAISNLKRIDQLPFIYDTFTSFIKSSSPGSKDTIFSSLQTLLHVPLTKNEKKSLLQKSKATKITIQDLLLTEQQLKAYNYPTALVDSTWKATKDLYCLESTTNPVSNSNERSTSETRRSKIYALDCEFCKAGAKQVLTRISLLDFEANVIMDELVKPKEKITDYVTKYSGITEELLQDVTTTIEDIQNLFVDKVSQQDILIGHSLESDLNVMKIKHDRIVDTSIIYEHNRGPPSKPSLKWLAEKYLCRQIQTGEDQGLGHSSIEDAKACLDLVKLKIIEGKLFGANVGEVSIFQRLSENPKYNVGGEADGSGKFKSLLVSYRQAREYDINPDEKYDLTKINVKNDDEAVENFVKEIHSKNFAVINLRDLEFNNKWNTPPDYYTGDLDYNQMESYKRTNQRLEQIYQSLPDHSLLICYSQSGDPREMFKLQSVRRNFQKCEKEGVIDVTKLPEEESWTFTKSEKLLEQTSLARESLMFMKIKPSSDVGSDSISNLSTEPTTSITTETSGGSSSSNDIKDIE
ncbi:conserved hypothetical protein [Candida dubliniensis CD36]|uniref:Exonuclease domain-containing protein n=1 Tax=Candida dubliniensis (strain CD36 / ATCC MYA-646 / CBS 7987 / NCPF 3949 / NRRL Y-17841) TaxID=573826 RepID=B9W8A1_CANDC|nr:conserved hypothetical protein [Candida dubliniensis CD36]CAX44955.1 conserved hypothetical protein [Candida dubliniensis CD36]